MQGLGKFLKKRRVELDLSVGELAQISGFSEKDIRRIENGGSDKIDRLLGSLELEIGPRFQARRVIVLQEKEED